MRIKFKGLFTLVSFAAISLATAEPPEDGSALGEAVTPPKVAGKDYKDYWEIMARGEFVKDLRPVKPAHSTDLREFALSLPILETPGEFGYAFVYRFSEAAPTAATWTLPGDGAQERMEIRRLKPGPEGAQRIEFERRLWRGAPMKVYTYYVKLERRTGGWHVLEGRFVKPKPKPKPKTDGEKKLKGAQDGADQPHTAPESKPEGKKKPKPAAKSSLK